MDDIKFLNKLFPVVFSITKHIEYEPINWNPTTPSIGKYGDLNIITRYTAYVQNKQELITKTIDILQQMNVNWQIEANDNSVMFYFAPRDNIDTSEFASTL